mmetsp:Transcript_10902/g.44618  ORF Transcript_10902/g.44618 Transcript_10902/m.44618 type:complete len:302 (+) Transcript_10902:1852-2757(+)
MESDLVGYLQAHEEVPNAHLDWPELLRRHGRHLPAVALLHGPDHLAPELSLVLGLADELPRAAVVSQREHVAALLLEGAVDDDLVEGDGPERSRVLRRLEEVDEAGGYDDPLLLLLRRVHDDALLPLPLREESRLQSCREECHARDVARHLCDAVGRLAELVQNEEERFLLLEHEVSVVRHLHLHVLEELVLVGVEELVEEHDVLLGQLVKGRDLPLALRQHHRLAPDGLGLVRHQREELIHLVLVLVEERVHGNHILLLLTERHSVREVLQKLAHQRQVPPCLWRKPHAVREDPVGLRGH